MNQEVYHYVESGLDNVYIYGLHFEDDQGKGYIRISAIKSLHLMISKSLLNESRPLLGNEFYFLRAELGLSIKSVADSLNLGIEQLTAWEQNNRTTLDLDKKFRQFVAEELSISDYEFREKSEQSIAESKINIQFNQEQKNYSPLSHAA